MRARATLRGSARMSDATLPGWPGIHRECGSCRGAPSGPPLQEQTSMKRLQFSGVAVLLMLLAVVAYAQTNGQPERFTANAVSTSPEYGTGQRIVEITVDRWSPNAERE